MGKKWPKMDFGPTGTLGKKWPKYGKIAILANFPIFGHFSTIIPVGPKSISRPFFANFGPSNQYFLGPAKTYRFVKPRTCHKPRDPEKFEIGEKQVKSRSLEIQTVGRKLAESRYEIGFCAERKPILPTFGLLSGFPENLFLSYFCPISIFRGFGLVEGSSLHRPMLLEAPHRHMQSKPADCDR